MNRLTGKKLLILGATAGETTLVKRARELGVYVIVTDYNTDYTMSPAKYIADECWDISWSDIDALEKKCREEHIQGVTAGYSEFRVENLIKLCARLDLPCYATTEQLEITRDKIKFKDTCRENGVPVVKEYSSIDEVDEYPVIVKPVDRAGSIGISIAANREELEVACKYALESSISKQIIIEKYIDKGTKIDFYYAVENGKITLVSTCDTVNAKANGYERVVQSAWLYPTRNTDAAIQSIDSALRRMIQNMGIMYGCIFFSGFACENGEFVFFECGFRLEGGHQYNYVNQKGPFNYLDLFILHALTGNTEEISFSLVNEDLRAVTVNIYAKKGIITQVKGFEEVAQIPDCCLALMQGRIGENCDDSHAILNKIAMFQFANTSVGQLQKDVERMYELFGVYDENGSDMIYDRIDTSLIPGWWNLKHNRNIVFKEKDNSISYEQIQRLLNIAHQENSKHGLVYATANQTVDKLVAKIGNGICIVALRNNDAGKQELVATCTLEERILKYWYIGEDIGTILLLKLVGVHPDCKGMGIGRKLMEYCFDYAKEHHYKMIVTDSAEENRAFRKLMNRSGFKDVDCVKYVANNFISTVYAKWVEDECPWTDDVRREKYALRRKQILDTNENRV